LNYNFIDLKITDLSLGENHCCAKDAENKIYTWGLVTDQGSISTYNTPQLLDLNNKASSLIKIQCGNNYTAFLNSDFTLMYFGNIGKPNCLNISQIRNSNSNNLKFIELQNVEDFACGRNLIFILDKNKCLYLFNEKEQLFTIKIDLKFCNIKCMEDRLYALSEDNQLLYEFRNPTKVDEKIGLNFSDFIETIYVLGSPDVKLINTPYYNNHLFFYQESKSNISSVNPSKQFLTLYNDVYPVSKNNDSASKIESHRGRSMSQNVLPPNEVLRQKQMRRDGENNLSQFNNYFTCTTSENVKIEQETVTPVNKKRNRDRISRISSLLGKIFENRIEQIETNYCKIKIEPKIEKFNNNQNFPRSRKASIEKVSDAICNTKINNCTTINITDETEIQMKSSRRSASIQDKINDLINFIKTDNLNLNTEAHKKNEKSFHLESSRLPPKGATHFKTISSFTERKNKQILISDKEDQSEEVKNKLEFNLTCQVIDRPVNMNITQVTQMTQESKFDNKKLKICNNTDNSFYLPQASRKDSLNNTYDLIGNRENGEIQCETQNGQCEKIIPTNAFETCTSYSNNTVQDTSRPIPLQTYKRPIIPQSQQKNRMRRNSSLRNYETYQGQGANSLNQSNISTPSHEKETFISEYQNLRGGIPINTMKNLNSKKINNSFLDNSNHSFGGNTLDKFNDQEQEREFNNIFTNLKQSQNFQKQENPNDETKFHNNTGMSSISNSTKGMLNNLLQSNEILKGEVNKYQIQTNREKNTGNLHSIRDDQISENDKNNQSRFFSVDKSVEIELNGFLDDREIDHNTKVDNELRREETVRDRMIKNLEAFKLSNVKEKLDNLDKRYHDIISESPVNQEKFRNENLLKSEKYPDYEPLELENTLRSISINASNQFGKGNLQLIQSGIKNLIQQKQNSEVKLFDEKIEDLVQNTSESKSNLSIVHERESIIENVKENKNIKLISDIKNKKMLNTKENTSKSKVKNLMPNYGTEAKTSAPKNIGYVKRANSVFGKLNYNTNINKQVKFDISNIKKSLIEKLNSETKKKPTSKINSGNLTPSSNTSLIKKPSRTISHNNSYSNLGNQKK
jgi:hypothetical protein